MAYKARFANCYKPTDKSMRLYACIFPDVRIFLNFDKGPMKTLSSIVQPYRLTGSMIVTFSPNCTSVTLISLMNGFISCFINSFNNFNSLQSLITIKFIFDAFCQHFSNMFINQIVIGH